MADKDDTQFDDTHPYVVEATDGIVTDDDLAKMRSDMELLSLSRKAPSGLPPLEDASDDLEFEPTRLTEAEIALIKDSDFAKTANEEIARLSGEMATLSKGWEGTRRRRNRIAAEYDDRVADAKEDIAEFEAAAGMSAAFFCKFVIRRRGEGADYAAMAEELNDPRRGIQFTGESVEVTFFDLSSDLRMLNAFWRSEPSEAPAIPPKEPTPIPAAEEQDHPVGIPYIRLKTFDMSGSGIADRIAGRKAATRSSGVPSVSQDDEPEEGLRLG